MSYPRGFFISFSNAGMIFRFHNIYFPGDVAGEQVFKL